MNGPIRAVVRCGFAIWWVAAAVPGQLAGESLLHFPRLSNQPGTITGVAIVNPRAEAAAVTVTAYLESGDLLSGEGILNPVEMEIQGGRQLALLTSDFFGNAVPEDVAGWFSVTSETNDLTGFFMFLDLEFTIFDGADLPLEASSLLLSDLRSGADHATEINILNPGDVEADIDLQLADGQGETRPGHLLIPARGSRRLDVAEFFDLQESAQLQTFSLTLEASTDIACFGLVKGPGDLLGLNASPLDQPVRKILFPQMAVLGGLESRLTLSSGSQEAVLVTITAHRPDGTLYDEADLQTNPVNRVIQPEGLLSEDLETLFGFAGMRTLEGWLEIEASSEALFGSLSYSVPVIGSVAAVSGASQGLTRALFSHIATDLGFFTGLAFLNSGALTANLQVVALRKDGTILGSFVGVLRPGERLSRLIEELVPGAAGQAGGFVSVKSDVPVYLTSIFGSLESGVFANIPPQTAPVFFNPDPAAAENRLTPPLAVLEPGSQQNFVVEGLQGPLDWTVNGEARGNAVVGTIDDDGRYRAPALIPLEQPVTVAAVSQTASVGASVDVLTPEVLRSDLGILQSVAYLVGLQRLFTAELLAGSPGGGLQGTFSSSTRISDVSGENSLELAVLSGEEVAKMIPWEGPDTLEYLLMSATNTGRVLRLDPIGGVLTEVASGLNQPTALALDPVDGSLLVAEETEVSSIPAASLSAGLAGVTLPSGQSSAAKKKLFELPRGRMSVNECTGNIFVSLPVRGQIVEFIRLTGALRILVEGLDNPGQPLGFYRRRMPCPGAFHLLVPERGTGQIQLAIPASEAIRPWIQVSGVVDMAFLAEGNPYAPGGGVLLAREDGRISVVALPRVYAGRGLNPPRQFFPGPCRILQATVTESGQNGPPFLSGSGGHLFFASTSRELGSNPDGNSELFDLDLLSRTLTQLTDTAEGESMHPVSDGVGGTVAFLSSANLTGSDPEGVHLFVRSGAGLGRVPGSPQQGQRYDLSASGTRLVYVSSDDITGSNPDGNPEVFLLETGQAPRQLTDTQDTSNGQVSISGSGNWVAFQSTSDIGGLNTEGDEVVYLLEIDAEIFTRVGIVRPASNSLLTDALELDFDASHVAFASSQNLTGSNPGGARVLYLYSRAEQAVQQVPGQIGRADLNDISAGGNVLALASNRNPLRLNPDTNREMFLLDLQAEAAFQVTRSRDVLNQSPTLSGGGQLLAFRSNADFQGQNGDGNFEIYVADCSGSLD